MNELENKALLPAGLRDILPPEAGHEAGIRETLVSTFVGHGYDRVKPPLVEFEDGLTSGAGAAVSADTFRLMDPVSQRMMGVRADMTTQVARIAASRLGDVPRPLRLSYTGEVLRTRTTQLRPERQFAQVGAELIGTKSATADIEIIQIAVESLQKIGVPNLSVDLNIPPLVPALMDGMGLLSADYQALREALDRKDVSAVRERGQDHAKELCRLMEGTGAADQALDVLSTLSLPSAPASELDRLKAVVEGIGERIPNVNITIDPVEYRGFEYHTGVGFTFFSRGERGEVGAGGRYVTPPNGDNISDDGEPATGFTLFIDTILRVVPAAKPSPRIFVPRGSDADSVADLRGDGWVTIAALDQFDDPDAEARRQGCDHILKAGNLVPLDKD
ncbi:MAG: ATP phosphoribosyltransferase regulatory subunit [Pseudomonadota bacterium]|nr:ATP phosphoribosyltransferase regulatory subunit [Pseudomonadota bacterium]